MGERLMRRIFLGFALLSAALCAAAERDAWCRRAPIEAAAAPDKGLIETALPPEVYDLAQRDLGDLRVVGRIAGEPPHSGQERAGVLRVAEGASRTVALNVRLYNRTFIEGKLSSVTADFGGKELKNRIEVITPGTNFRRRALVEGSDDGTTWRTVVADALLFRIRGDGGRSAYDKNAIELPDNDQRTLRVTVHNAPDDPPRLEPIDVRAWRHVVEPGRFAPVPLLKTRVQNKEDATLVELDLGYRNLPLQELSLRFTDANFFRRLTVCGRQQETVMVRREFPSGPTRAVEVPWGHITDGAIYRYTSGGRAEEALTIRLQGTTCRYLLVRIENGADPALHYDGASATRLIHFLGFPPRAGARYFLYFGNPGVSMPVYDLPHYVERLRREGVARATLGAAVENPPREPEPEVRPRDRVKSAEWGERYKAILWVVLFLVLCVHFLIVYRQARSVKPPQ